MVRTPILYVDDSDILHVASSPTTSEEDFLASVQTATTDWGKLVQATRGYLKPSKYFWYMLSWKWINGIPKLKNVSELPTTALKIPQSHGESVTIPLKGADEA